ncbi:Sm-like protein LSM8 [Diplonema papillatum]|nr:Sm-like protein LSM8 [Diplonema papillatum]WGM49943.1 LSm8 [Diplonema papillatum]
MAALDGFVDHVVSIITNDGRHLVGTLKGFDQTINVILSESHERVYQTDEPVQQVVTGLSIIRGDDIATVGLLDEQIDSTQNLAAIRAEPIKPVRH